MCVWHAANVHIPQLLQSILEFLDMESRTPNMFFYESGGTEVPTVNILKEEKQTRTGYKTKENKDGEDEREEV